MTELQIRLLNILKWFHEFCVDNDLKYYALGGTMLGAMRHKGFIPWDDDIDVGLPRNDYEKMILIMNKKVFAEKYILERPLQNRDYIYPYCKIYDITTTLIENAREKIKRGIYIDVFPLDGIGNDKAEVRRNYRKIKILRNLCTLKTVGFRKGRRMYKNFGVALFRAIPVDSQKILRQLVKKCAEHSYNDSLYCGNLVGKWGNRELMLRDVMGEPVLYAFQDIKIYGAEKADIYLTNLYGDWRKLPPEKRRVTHHDCLKIDLNNAYLGE